MRRRVLIALAIVACLGSAAWWTLWRGDRRFVGQWQILGDTDDPTRKEIVFAANGTGERRGSDSWQSWTAYQFDWWVEEDIVVLREEPPEREFELRRSLNELYWMLTGNARGGIVRRLQFEEVGPGRMRVWQVDGENQALGQVFEIVRSEE